MMKSSRWRRLLRFIRNENLHTLFMVIVGIVTASAIGISIFETDLSFFDGIWWSVVTLTTVGYGDISPSTPGGRILAFIVMVFGIGLLGMLSGSLASMLISKRDKENKGMSVYDLENHIIICEWNVRAKAIIKELRSYSKMSALPVVLIAAIEEKPVDDRHFHFIRGNVTDETLERANLERAQSVIVLGDDKLEPTARDAKVVLSALTIESLHSDVHTVVELVDPQNVKHCERANADEIIIGSELASHLIANSAIHHGISKVMTDLLSSQFGNELYSVPASPAMVGKTFMEAFVALKKEKNCIALGIQKGQAGEVSTNPPETTVIERGDYIVLIAKDIGGRGERAG